MNLIKLFIHSAGGILLAAALIRFVIVVGDAPVLALPEPMLGIPLHYAVLTIGGIELVVALICLFGKQAGFQIGWLAWLTTAFLVYRIGLYWMHHHPQATCIGGLTDPLHLSHGIMGAIVEIMPFYLLIGSYVAVIWFWLEESTMAQIAGSLKMSCPYCGGHIMFATQNLGQNIPCPHCQTNITLRKPDLLKTACFFCREHIEFPAHAIGEKISCPHCKMDITLKEPA